MTKNAVMEMRDGKFITGNCRTGNVGLNIQALAYR